MKNYSTLINSLKNEMTLKQGGKEFIFTKE